MAPFSNPLGPNDPAISAQRAANQHIQSFIDNAAHHSAKLGKPVRCKAGCFQCCREPVMAELNEVRLIVSTLTPAQVLDLGPMVEKWWREFFAARLHELPNPQDDDFVARDGLYSYRAANLWCPLLRDGMCSVYQERPISCRMHNAVGNPKHCGDEKKRRKQLFMMTREDAGAVADTMGIACQSAAMALFQYDYLGIWLGHLLLGKSERSGAGADVIVRQTDPRGAPK